MAEAGYKTHKTHMDTYRQREKTQDNSERPTCQYRKLTALSSELSIISLDSEKSHFFNKIHVAVAVL